MKIFLLALAFFFSTVSWAGGHDVGNGGNVVLCMSASGNIIAEFYDHFEAKDRFAVTPDLGATALSVDAKLGIAFARMARLNPSRADLYRAWYRSFASESAFLTHDRLQPIPDVGLSYVPDGCDLKQLAVQQEPEFPGDKRYTIDKSLYDQMDNDNVAMFILHELILREMRAQKIPQTSSTNARYFNAMVASKVMDGYNLKQYFDLAGLVQFESADTQGGIPVQIPDPSWFGFNSCYKPLEFSADGNSLLGAPVIVDNAEYVYNVYGLKIRINSGEKDSGSCKRLSFYDNGITQELHSMLGNQELNYKMGPLDVHMKIGDLSSAIPEFRTGIGVRFSHLGEPEFRWLKFSPATVDVDSNILRGSCIGLSRGEDSRGDEYISCEPDLDKPAQALSNGQWTQNRGTCAINGYSVFDTGELRSFCSDHIKLQTPRSTLWTSERFLLYKSGMLHAAVLTEHEELPVPGGKTRSFEPYDIVAFDEDGFVIDSCSANRGNQICHIEWIGGFS